MVGFKVKYYCFQIEVQIFYFLFSTVAYNLKNEKWGN